LAPGVGRLATQTGKQSSGSAPGATTQQSSLVSNDVQTATKRRTRLRHQHQSRPSPIVIRNIHLTASDGQNALRRTETAHRPCSPPQPPNNSEQGQITVNSWVRRPAPGGSSHRRRDIGHESPSVDETGIDRWGPRRCFLAGVCRAADVLSPAPREQPHHPRSSARHLPGPHRRDPVARPPWAEAERAHTGSAGTMTRAAVIAPKARPQSCCERRQVRAAGVGTGPRRPTGDGATGDPCTDARTLGTAAPKRTAAHGTGRIGLSSSSASRWRCTVCTPSSTAGDGTKVRGHRCAGIETQPKRGPLT